MKAIKSIKLIDKLNKRLDIIENNDEEIRKKKTSAEARHQEPDVPGYFHESSWYMRHDNGYDGYGCNQFTGCVPECKYYAKEGKLDDEEWKANVKTKEE